MFISRIIEGLGGGNLGVASSYVADITTEEQRPQALSYVTAAFGAGFIVGPILSGALSQFGFTVPFLAAALLQAVVFLLTATLLPESHAPSASKLDVWRELRTALRTSGVGNILARRFLYIFAFTYFFTTFSLYLSDVLHAGPGTSSLMLGIAGFVGAVTQVAGIQPLVRHFGLHRTTLAAFAAGILAYALLGFAVTFALFVPALALWAFSGSVLRPAIDTRITEIAPAAERGTFLSLGDSFDNLSMIFAPTLGAAVVGAAPHWVGVIPALALAAGFALTLQESRPSAA